LVPGAISTSIDGAVVCHCLLAIDDEEEHASHFWIRDAASEGLRPFQKYLDALPEIRRIQTYLIERAGRAGVPVIQNYSIEGTIDQVVDLVLAEVERARVAS
jgi:2-phosphoglycerate kinase